MQPYIVFGYGIKTSKIEERNKEVVSDLCSHDGLYYFYEDADPSESIMYIVYSSPFSKDRKESTELCAWSATFNKMEIFKRENEKFIEEELEKLGLSEYQDLVDFYVSATEI